MREEYVERTMHKYENRDICPEEFVNKSKNLLSSTSLSYCGKGAVVGVVTWEQSSILYKHCHSFQDKSNEELDVNKVPGTTQPPVENTADAHNKYIF